MTEKLPDGWIKTTLGEIAAPSRKRVLPTDAPAMRYVGLEHIESQTMKLLAFGVARDSRSSSLVFFKGDVLYAKMRPYLNKVWVAEFDGLCSAEFIVFPKRAGLNSRFLAMRLNTDEFVTFANAQVSGERPRVDFDKLSGFPILLPPNAEQERIVAKISASWSRIDGAETATRHAQERLDRYRVAVRDYAVRGELTRVWRESEYKREDVGIESAANCLETILAGRRARWNELEATRSRNDLQCADLRRRIRYPEPATPISDGLSKLPQTWIWASLDQLLLHIADGDHQPPPQTESGVPFLVIGNISAGKLDLTSTRFVSAQYAHSVSPFRKPVRGDILYSLVGSFGIAVKVDTDIEFCIQRHLAVLRPHALSPTAYIYLTLNSSLIFHQAVAIATGTAQKTVPLVGLRRVAIPLPPPDEQLQIIADVERRLSAADRLAETLQQQIIRIRATRQSLLREAFAGHIASQDSHDEPASLLLSRLKAQRIVAKEPVQGAQRQPMSPKRISPMVEQLPSSGMLNEAWQRIGRVADARRLFNEAALLPEQVTQFYEILRGMRDLREVFEKQRMHAPPFPKPLEQTKEPQLPVGGRFRLGELWLEDFKNLKDYTVRFDPTQAVDVVLGWNGTGKSNLFEALVIIFRDLHEWWAKNRWPDKPLNAFRLSYEVDGSAIEVTWQPLTMKRPALRRALTASGVIAAADFIPIKRRELSLPHFVFGYYSGPTNRLAEHFLPMKQAHYDRLREAKADDAHTLGKLLEQRRFFCAETHHAKYVLLAFSYKDDPQVSDFLESRLRIVGFDSALFVIRKPRWAKPRSKAEEFWGATGIMRRVMERLRSYSIAPMVLEQKVSYGYRSTTEDHYYFFCQISQVCMRLRQTTRTLARSFWRWRALIFQNLFTTYTFRFASNQRIPSRSRSPSTN